MAMSEEARVLVERFDAHLERFDAQIATNDAVLERNTQAFDRNTRAWGHTVAALKNIGDEIADGRDERRAQTEAILRMLDRLDEGGSTT